MNEPELYARLCLSIAATLRLIDVRRDTNVDWPIMRSAMEHLTRRCPTASIIGGLANMAYNSGDYAEMEVVLNSPLRTSRSWAGAGRDLDPLRRDDREVQVGIAHGTGEIGGPARVGSSAWGAV